MPDSSNRIRLIVLSGSRVGHELAVAGEAVLGRLAQCDLRLDDVGVSRRHARVRVEEGQVWLEDLGSANGTKLRGARVQEARIEDGDVFELAKVKVRLRIEGREPARAAPGPGELAIDEAELEPRAEPPPRRAPQPPAVPRAQAPAQMRDRARGGALQFHRNESKRGWLQDDLSQAGPLVRLLVVLVLVAVAALVFWLAYTGF